MAKTKKTVPVYQEEINVLDFCQKGNSIKMIKDFFPHVPWRTLQGMSANVQSKLGATNLTHAVALSIRAGTLKSFIIMLNYQQQIAAISKRENEILDLLQHGLSAVQIGKKLNISPYTVRDHIAAIKTKLGAKNTPNAVAIAIHTGLI